MKLTDEIVKAMNGCIEDGCKSLSEFSRLTNVSTHTLSKYLRKETRSIKDETWEKIYPLLKPYLGKKEKFVMTSGKPIELKTDQRILLDAFADLPLDVQQKKLMEIIELAKKYNKEKQEKE